MLGDTKRQKKVAERPSGLHEPDCLLAGHEASCVRMVLMAEPILLTASRAELRRGDRGRGIPPELPPHRHHSAGHGLEPLRTPFVRRWVLMQTAVLLFYEGISRGSAVFRSSKSAADLLFLRAELPYGEGDSTGNTSNTYRRRERSIISLIGQSPAEVIMAPFIACRGLACLSDPDDVFVESRSREARLAAQWTLLPRMLQSGGVL
jgi:hypothetical protein